jgi:hypothetical protein
MTSGMFELLGFGPKGWGLPLLQAAGVTIASLKAKARTCHVLWSEVPSPCRACGI